MTYACLKEAEIYLFFFAIISMHFLRYRNLWAVGQRQKKKKNTKKKTKLYHSFHWGVVCKTCRQRDQQGELCTERHRHGSLFGLASLRGTEEELGRRNARTCMQKSTLGRHSCKDCWFIRGQKEEQVWQEWYLCCWQFCCALCCCKAIREAGTKGHWCLFGTVWMRESCVRASRRVEWMASFRARSQAEGMGQEHFHFCVPCTQSLELFPIYLGSWSILIRKKEEAHLEAWSTIEKDWTWIEKNRKWRRHTHFESWGQIRKLLAQMKSWVQASCINSVSGS